MAKLVDRHVDARVEGALDVDRADGLVVHARERLHVLDDAAHAIRALDRFLDGGVDLRGVRGGRQFAQPFRHVAQVREGIGERVVDLVSDARGQRSNRREPVGHAQLGLRLAQLFLGALLSGEVAQRHDPPDQLALEQHRTAGVVEREHRTARARQGELLVHAGVGLQGQIHPGLVERMLGTGQPQEIVERTPEDLARTTDLQEPQRGGVAEGDAAGKVETAEALRGRVEEEPHPLLALEKPHPRLRDGVRHLVEGAASHGQLVASAEARARLQIVGGEPRGGIDQPPDASVQRQLEPGPESGDEGEEDAGQRGGLAEDFATDGGTNIVEGADGEEHRAPVGLHRRPDDGARSVDDGARPARLAGIGDSGRQGDRLAAPAKSVADAKTHQLGRIGCEYVAVRGNEDRGAQRRILAPGAELANHLDRGAIETRLLEELAHSPDLLRQDVQPQFIDLPGFVRELRTQEEGAKAEREDDEHEQQTGPQRQRCRGPFEPAHRFPGAAGARCHRGIHASQIGGGERFLSHLIQNVRRRSAHFRGGGRRGRRNPLRAARCRPRRRRCRRAAPARRAARRRRAWLARGRGRT